MNEKWKPITNFENLYEISNFGRVKSLERITYASNGKIYKFKEKILNPKPNNKGYLHVQLILNKKRYYNSVHKLVANAFILNPYNKPQINHIDGNKINNHFLNLEWVTSSENTKHAYILNLNKGNGKTIIQIFKNKKIEEFKSIRDASMKTKICYTCIRKCCNGIRKSAGGYNWKYK
jgi:hypothetical protein